MSIDQEKKNISLYSPHLIELMQAVFDKGLPFRFQAKGGSMSPFIKDSDILTLARFSGDYSIGDVAAFVRPEGKKLVVHRIVAKKNNAYLIKGDNGFGQDSLIPKENILGRVIKVDRGTKNISFGLGPEKHLIAFLSRTNLLPVLFFLPRMSLSLLRKIRNF
ncbi:MAG: S24/S26 family peptidase [Candidatus Saganbacteria bacterium]|nr:S24/S26 family peptidase [Candidatus Saganbacteria bacterium]